MLAFSQKALATREHSTCPKCFLDIQDHINANKVGYFPYTPSTPILYGLRKSLDLLLEEGLENVFARHYRLAEGVRKAIQAWGLELCAKGPNWYSDTVSAILVPDGFNAQDVITTAYDKYNIALGAGLSEVAGKVFRIGHLGDLNDVSCLAAIAGTEMALLDNGIEIQPGIGVGAAIEYYRNTA